MQSNKDAGTDWFRLESNKEGTKWFGKCWVMNNLLKYEFNVEFEVRKYIKFYLRAFNQKNYYHSFGLNGKNLFFFII